MCGIVGYVGNLRAADFLLEGLRRLEYRGYDSAGLVAVDRYEEFHVVKTAGRIGALGERLATNMPIGTTGIGHTRWATHGAATEANAHPHLGPSGQVAVVHNGVIENYAPLKAQLQQQGYVFRSETDTEVIAHLLEDELKQLSVAPGKAPSDTVLAGLVRKVLSKLRGTYGIGVLFQSRPDLILAARLGSPLVIGVAEGAHFLASDASPLVGYTDKIVYLADHQVALLKADSLEIAHRDLGQVTHSVETLEIASGDVDLGDFEHYMLKEIFEQPQALENVMRGRLSLDDATAVFGGLSLSPQELRGVDRILLTACGTSWHAAMVGEYLIEELARIPVEVEYASELRYRNPPVPRRTLVFGITQSGETADTLAALREMKRKGHPTLAICNVVGSSIAQEADGGIYLHAGPEIGVASTKAYTSQLAVMAMLGLYFGRLNHLSFDQGYRIIRALQKLPDKVRQALTTQEQAKKVAEKYQAANNFLYLGRYFNFPTALEGALKLKEISYIHAEAYPTGEMKHGPIALIDRELPVVVVATASALLDKTVSNMQEVRARDGLVVAVVNDDDDRAAAHAQHVLRVPRTLEALAPVVDAVPLQLLAYEVAHRLGRDVDQPRNLAKSVTVE